MIQAYSISCKAHVALLAEGVDRNMGENTETAWEPVALLAEGVDRNILLPILLDRAFRRPPRGGRG